MRTHYCKYLSFLAILALALPIGALSQSRLLETGMRFSEVVSLLGAPQLKQEHESLRRDIWYYTGDTLFFREGRLVRWASMPTQLLVKDPGVGARKLKKPPVSVSSDTSLSRSRTRQDVSFRDILKSIPSEDGKKERTDTSPVVQMQHGPRGVMPFEAPPVGKPQ